MSILFKENSYRSGDVKFAQEAAEGGAKDCVTAPSHLQLTATRRGRVTATIILLATVIFSLK